MPNNRRCPFYGCSKLIDPTIFACREHWPGLDDDDRAAIWKAYSDYIGGGMHIDDLHRIQAEIMLKNTPQLIPGAAKATTAGEVALAKQVKEYVRLRKEYTSTKDGLLEKKKRIGMELSRKESELVKECDKILHPPQTQLSLFENPAAENQQMPD